MTDIESHTRVATARVSSQSAALRTQDAYFLGERLLRKEEPASDRVQFGQSELDVDFDHLLGLTGRHKLEQSVQVSQDRLQYLVERDGTNAFRVHTRKKWRFRRNENATMDVRSYEAGQDKK